ncbi:MAG: type II toxin-antitoxin system RelE/ParE family toxin [Planctomycetia bacterium]|jgi:hypothetical protein
MRAEFVETSEFTATIREYLNDEDYSNLQRLLMEQPNRGVVIPGCNGLRKLRVANESRGKGKRGGCRVIYLYVPEACWFFMLDIYSKDEQENLSAAERRLLSQLATELKTQAKFAAGRRSKEPP